MANNGGRQAGGGGNGQMNEHVEFTVKAEEDLYLSGSENTIRRVIAETNYSCLMLKTQRFSSLFRHYAKYHGLRKDDLEYYFVNPLDNEDTPESVQLQRGDTIMVRKRRKPEPPEAAADDDEFYKDMRDLLEDEEHMDCVFLVHPEHAEAVSSSSPPAASSSSHYNPSYHHFHVGSKGSSSNINNKNNNNSSTATVAATGCTSTTTAAATSSGSSSSATNDISVKQEAQDEDLPDASKTTASAVAVAVAVSSSDNKDTDEPMQDLDSSKATHKTHDNDYGNKVAIRAHKCILTARGEYFKALFRKNHNVSTHTPAPASTSSSSAFKESVECTIRVEPDFTPSHIRYLLEFVYTNRLQCIKDLSTDDLLSMLHLSDRWLLRDLKRLVEHELIRNHMTIQTVARMYGATEDFKAQRLSRACIDFIMENLRQLAGNAAFEEEMKNYPHLCIPVLKAAADLIPEPVPKKQRTDHHSSTSSSNNNAGSGSNNNATTTPSSSGGAASGGSGGAGGGGSGGASGGGAPGAAAAAAAGGGPGGAGAGGGNAAGGAGGALGSLPVPDSDP